MKEGGAGNDSRSSGTMTVKLRGGLRAGIGRDTGGGRGDTGGRGG
jgi:hypothetical protein